MIAEGLAGARQGEAEGRLVDGDYAFMKRRGDRSEGVTRLDEIRRRAKMMD
jgi:hypothetical protein